MFPALFAALALSPTAMAQDRGRYIDPDYLDYLASLEEAEELEITADNDQCQLWDGEVAVGLMSSPTRIGTVFVGGGDWEFKQTKEETWYFSALPAWGNGFRLVHQGPYDEGSEGAVLASEDPGWAAHPCFNMMVKYTVQPDPELTAQWDFADNIDRYHFDLLQLDPVTQTWEKQGDLLREWHHVPNTPEKYVDHWAFYDTYEKPMNAGDELQVVPATDQYGTTSAFWAELHDLQDAYFLEFGVDRYDRYAQVQYKRRSGLQCMIQQGF